MSNTVEQNLQRLVNATNEIGKAVAAKGGTVAQGDRLEAYPVDITTIPPYKMTGELPLTFKSDGENLRDYTIYGNEDGVGESDGQGGYVIPIVSQQSKRKTGNPINITDAAAYPAESVVTTLEPVQEGSGDPSPENVRPITGHTGVELTRTGKNLFDMSTITNNCYLTSIGTLQSSNASYVTDYIQAHGKVTLSYTFETLASTNSRNVCFFDKNKEFIQYTSYSPQNNSATFNIPDNAAYIRLTLDKQVTANQQLELGSTATTYDPYQPETHSVTFPALGKNLFNINGTVIHHKFISSAGNYVDSPSGGTDSDVYTDLIPVIPTEKYTLSSVSSSSKNVRIAFYDSEEIFINRVLVTMINPTSTFEVPSNARYIRLSPDVNVDSIQIEKGTTATAYEPYTNTAYGCEVDWVNGILRVTNINVDLGTLTWSLSESIEYLFSAYLPSLSIDGTLLKSICSKYVTYSTSTIRNKNYGHAIASRGNVIYIKDIDQTQSTINSGLSGVQLVYELATPIEYDLTPQQIELFKNYNNLFADSGTIDLKYLAEVITNIPTAAQLFNGDSLSLADTSLQIPTIEGINTIDTTLENKPSMFIEYGDNISPVPVEVEEKDVDFYDYDGTLLYSYTAAEFAELSEMPPNPTHVGLTAQGWNWTLADAKEAVAEYGILVIGQLYITDDGKTRIYLDEIDANLATATLTFTQTVANGVEIDWGDGSATETVSGTGTVSATHTYQSTGAWTITLNPADGCDLGFTGSLFGETSPFTYNVKKIKLGNVKNLAGLCYKMHNLKTISIPDINVTDLNTFSESGLECLVLPTAITTIGSAYLSDMTSLKAIAINKNVTTVSSATFKNNHALRKVIKVTANSQMCQDCWCLEMASIASGVTTINTYVFQYATRLRKIVVPSTVTAINGYAFGNCRSLAEVHIKPVTPPTLANANVFSNTPSGLKIYVPYSADHSVLAAYKAANKWSDFENQIFEESE